MNINLDELKKVGIVSQRKKDYLLFRLRTVAGDLTADQLTAAAGRILKKYADGKIHLTARQGVEIHRIQASKLQEVSEALDKNGLTLGACGPRGRGIVACPGSATCTFGIIEIKELAAELDREYFRKGAPHEFKIGVSGCPNNCSKSVENDVGVMGGVLPGWQKDQCINCQRCIHICPTQALENREDHYILDLEKCILCGLCIINCPANARDRGRAAIPSFWAEPWARSRGSPVGQRS